jgi:hypothetical protein
MFGAAVFVAQRLAIVVPCAVRLLATERMIFSLALLAGPPIQAGIAREQGRRVLKRLAGRVLEQLTEQHLLDVINVLTIIR